jgi:tetratricopeptide (TPR) repeat protein
MAWCAQALGAADSARALLRRAGYAPEPGPTPEIQSAIALHQSGRTQEAIAEMEAAVRRHALDPAAHGLLADLKLILNPEDPAGTIEAFAARALAPTDAVTWRRWAMVQAQRARYLEALRSFERYFQLGGAAARDDAEAQKWVKQIRDILPGGDVSPEGLRE